MCVFSRGGIRGVRWLLVHVCPCVWVCIWMCVWYWLLMCVGVGRMLMTESLAVHQDITRMYVHTYTGTHKHLVDTRN